MTIPAEEIADRLEIFERLDRYAIAVDERDFSAVRDTFADDAHLDYSEFGGPAGSAAEVVAWLEKVLAHIGATQHHITTRAVAVIGDEASSRAYVWNPMMVAGPSGDEVSMAVGGEYRDTWRRTPRGWRIVFRKATPRLSDRPTVR